MIKKIPMRRCVGCMEQKSKRELIRVVRSPEGEISLDTTGKKPGRGAYLCPDPELDIGIYHNQAGFIIIQILYKNRHNINTKQLTNMSSCVSCNNLITAFFSGSYNSRHQHTMLTYAFYHFLQFFI